MQTYSSDIVESLKIKQDLFDLKKKKVQSLKKNNGCIKTYQCTKIRIDVAFIWMAFKDPKLKRMGHLTKSFDLKIVLLHLHSYSLPNEPNIYFQFPINFILKT